LSHDKQGVAEAFQNDEANLYYIYDTSDGRLKQRMVSNYDERQAFAQGFKDTPEQALRVHGIIRSKFNPTKWVQKQGTRWVEVFPFGRPELEETSEYNYSNINDDDWYEFDSRGNVVRQSGPRRYELPFGSNKTIKLPNGNIAAKGMTAKRLKLFKNLSESREYYNVMCTDAKSLRQNFNMSKDRLGWFLKEGSTPKQKLDVYRAFGGPKLKEFNLAAFSGGTQTKGDDNVISPVGSIPNRKKIK
jgi:hypothetical protein